MSAQGLVGPARASLRAVAAFWLAVAAGYALAQDPVADEISTAPEVTDAQIERRLNEIYAEIDGLGAVTVTSESGVVTLDGTVLNAATADRAERLASAVSGVVAVQNSIQRDNRFASQLRQMLEKLQETALNALRVLPIGLIALAVIVFFWAIGGFVSRRLTLPRRLAPNVFVRDLARLAVRLVMTLVGVLIGAQLLDATALLASVLGGIGVAGLAVGFAIRDTVENFVASILLSVRQPFGVNEHVVVDGNEGRVLRLTSRATILMDFDGNHVRLPNSVVYKSTIVNYTRHPQRRCQFDVGIDSAIDPAFAQRLAVETLGAMPGVLDEPPVVCIVTALGDSNVVLRIFGWVDQNTTDFGKTRSAAMAAVKNAFQKADIDMPEPIYRLRVRNMDGGPEKQPAPARNVSPPAADDLAPDKTIEVKVAQQEDENDLLDRNAPRE